MLVNVSHTKDEKSQTYWAVYKTKSTLAIATTLAKVISPNVHVPRAVWEGYISELPHFVEARGLELRTWELAMSGT